MRRLADIFENISIDSLFEDIKEKSKKKENLIKTKKLTVREVLPPSPSENILEKIRKNRFPGEVLYLDLQKKKVFSPEELLSLFYIRYNKDAPEEHITNLIENSINNLLFFLKEKNIDIDTQKLNNLKRLLKEEKQIEKILEEYKRCFDFYNKNENIIDKQQYVYNAVLEFLPLKHIEKSKVNIFINKAHPVAKALTSNQTRIFFTEKDPFKKFLMEKSTGAFFIDKYFCTCVGEIKDESFDFGFLFLDEEQQVSLTKEQILNIKRITRERKIIDKSLAFENLVIKHAIGKKIKNWGITVFIAPSHMKMYRKIENRKWDIVSIPILTFAIKNSNEESKTMIDVIDKDGNLKKEYVSKTISIHVKMDKKEFMKSPLEDYTVPFLIEDIGSMLKEIQELKRRKILNKFYKRLDLIQNMIIKREFTKAFERTCLQIQQEMIKSNSKKHNHIKKIKKDLQKVENEADMNELLKELAFIHSKVKRTTRMFYINLIKNSVQMPIEENLRRKKENLKKLAEKLFFKLRGKDSLIFFHIQVVNELITDRWLYSKDTISSYKLHQTKGGRFISSCQDIYIKPFDFVFSKKDFENLVIYLASNEYLIKIMEMFLKEKLKQIQIINENNLFEEETKILTEIINKATKKDFKSLLSAFKFIFSKDFNGNVDRKVLLSYKQREIPYIVSIFIEIIGSLKENENQKIIENNLMYACYLKHPGVVKRMINLYEYIKEKEDICTKVTIKKTLEKIKSLEDEIKNEDMSC